MLYWVSTIFLLVTFLAMPKSEKKQNILVWLPISFVSYECWTCFVTGLLTILHISANINMVTIGNFLLGVLILVYEWNEKKLQKYIVDWQDLCFVILFLILAYAAWQKRFTPDLLIRFETSDPGPHLKYAMDFINRQYADGMYLGAISNGLFIESLSKVFSGAFVYKPFIIKYAFNFAISGWIFFAAARQYAEKLSEKLIIYGVTIVYLMGYPLSDMLFGFCYLQLTITIATFLVLVVKLYMENTQKNNWLYVILMSLGCLGVGVGYTLFAPVTFISVIICIGFKAYKEEWFWHDKIVFLHQKFIKTCLQVFLMPTLFTIYFTILQSKLSGGSGSYVSALNMEGYIYRNLYADFLLFIVFAVFAAGNSIKKKEINFSSILFLGSGLFSVILFIFMVNEKVSTYYFYKMNYFLWMIILMCFTIGILEMRKKEKMFVNFYLLGIILLVVCYRTGFETNYQEKNINYLPFAEAGTFFRINEINQVYFDRATEISPKLVDICDVINKEYHDEGDVQFIGYWMDLYWYEALTNQRLSGGSVDMKVSNFIQGNYGKYMVVIKGSSEYLDNSQLFETLTIVFDNDYAFIATY